MLDERLKGAVVVASVSGGKDSAALSLWLTEQGIEHRRVFADTGWEHDLTYEYLRGPLTLKLGPIAEVAGPLKMRDLVLKKAMFPSRLRRFCTEDLKVRPILKFVELLQDEGHEVVNAVGIRAAESDARSKLTEWEWSDAFDCWVWRPLIAWTEQDVIDIHKRHGLAPNPLYLKGAQRVGCFPCIFARKAEIKLVAEIAPERIEEIRQLEADVTKGAEERIAARLKAGTITKDEEVALRELLPRTYFHGKLSRKSKPFPIDTIVAWSKTGHGGKQFDLIDEQPEGCVRWGLCESAPKEVAP